MMAVSSEDAIRVLAEVRQNQKPPTGESEEMRELRWSIEIAWHCGPDRLQEVLPQWIEDELSD